MVKLALFDLDGTLVDSRKLIHAAMDDAFRKSGLGGCAYDTVRRIVGIELTEAVRMILPPDYPEAGAAKVTQDFREAFVMRRADGSCPEDLYEGARDILGHLEGRGWLLGVATGKPRRGLDRVFEHHGLHPFFVTLQTGCGGPGKPHPRMVLDALGECGAQAGRAVMIGDTSHDMLMARNARVRAVGVSWGFHTAEEVAAAGAHEVHHDFEALGAGLSAFAQGLEEINA